MRQQRNGKIVEQLSVAETTVVRGRLYYTIGLPRSGKSCFATRWMKGLEDSSVIGPRAVVCGDNFRLAVTGQRFNSYSEDIVHVLKKYSVEPLLSRGFNVLLDETNCREESLRKIYEIDIEAQYYFVTTDVRTCIQRAKDCDQPDLIPAINRIDGHLQKLLTEKGGLDNTIDRIRFSLSERQPIIVG